MEVSEKSFSELEGRCLAIAERFRVKLREDEQGLDESAARIWVLALSRGLSSSVFVRVGADYYDRDLDYRRHCLSAVSVEHLCKSIVMENKQYSSELGFPEDDLRYNRYYMVVLQYTRRLNPQNVLRYVRDVLNSGRGISSKHYNFRLADDVEKLTGFTHNSVTPLGSKTSIPILLSDNILNLKPAHFWLGAGETDLKWCIDIDQFRQSFNPHIATVTFTS
ncbi:hypothetical protein NDN08_007027 [Rhodosorus marinus]|uniref:YbaK/aminoacyl-tRNA synthetase-associated domain-containing protein n=1 Tax=Rhodosorus marinus TaxID=101924 RepID=A0AAV8UJ31_9RHOD|nr:hypothetical protein NDN08_007027 [Rhodosorus marinus]